MAQFADRDTFAPAPAATRRRLSCGTVALGCLGVVVVLAIVVAGSVWFYFRQQHYQALRDVQVEVDRIHAAGEPVTPEDMFAFHRVPPGTNDATELWMRAIELSPKSRDGDAKVLPMIGEQQGYELLDPNHPLSLAPVADRFFQNHVDVIDAMRTAAEGGGQVRFPLDFSAGLQADLSHVNELRHLARVLCLRNRLALAHRDVATALETVDLLLDLASTLDHEPTAVSQLVRLAIIKIHISELEALLNEVQLSDAQLARLQQRLANVNFREGMRLQMLGERAIGYHAFYHMSAMESGKEKKFAKYEGMLVRPADCRFFLDTMRELLAATEEPPYVARTLGQQVIAKVDSKVHSKNPLDRLEVIMTALLVPALDFTFDSYARAEVKRDSAVAGIAFRRYQLKHAQQPGTLDSLVPEFIDAVPRDLFSDGAKPLNLIVKNDKFAVYSVGRDRKDDQALLSDPASDADYGFVARLSIPTAEGR